jgi:hypothetical protein
LSGLGFNSLRVKKSYPKKPLSYPDFIEKRTQLDIAATALLMGMSPADHECDTAWPGVGTEGDWYWPGELPKVVAYIRSSGIDYAHGMPSLGDRSTSPAAAIVGYQTEPVPEAREICRLSGRLGTESGVGSTPSFQNGFWAPRRIFPIRQMNGKVVGYALNAGSNGAVVGHVFCKDSIEQQPLYLSAIE